MNHTQTNAFIIFSVFKADRTDVQNGCRHAVVHKHLTNHGVPFKEVDGQYGGEHEKSFLVGSSDYDLVYGLAQEYEQESILLVDEDRQATLRFVGDYTGESNDLHLGTFERTYHPKGRDYTFDPSTNQYWVIT